MFIVFCRPIHSFDWYRASCGRNIPITTGKPDLVKGKMRTQHCINGKERKNKNTHNTCAVNFQVVLWKVSIPVAARSNAWVCGRSLSGTVGLNPTWNTDICLLSKLYVVQVERSLRRADYSYRGVLPSVVCLSVTVTSR